MVLIHPIVLLGLLDEFIGLIGLEVLPLMIQMIDVSPTQGFQDPLLAIVEGVVEASAGADREGIEQGSPGVRAILTF